MESLDRRGYDDETTITELIMHHKSQGFLQNRKVVSLDILVTKGGDL